MKLNGTQIHTLATVPFVGVGTGVVGGGVVTGGIGVVVSGVVVTVGVESDVVVSVGDPVGDTYTVGQLGV